MNRRCLLPLILILALVMTPILTMDSEGDSSGTIGGVDYAHFDDEQSITINETCTVSLSLYNTNGEDVLVKITKTSDSFRLVNGGGEYPIESGDAVAITLGFDPDRSIRQGTYDVGIRIDVWDSATGATSTGTTSFSIKVSSIYSNEQYYNKILGVFDNPLPDPFNTVESTIFISMCIWLIIAIMISMIIPFVIRFAIRKKTGDDFDFKVMTPVFICIMIFAVCNCMRIYGMNESLISTIVFWANLVYIPLIAFIIWKVYKAIVYRVLNNLEKKTGNEYIYEAVSPLLYTIGKIAIVVVGTAVILSTLGLNLAVIITGAGIAGLAVSLGTKSAFNELFSGITILITRPFRVGDTIRIADSGNEMRVENVGILRTEFVNKHNVDHFAIPNSTLASSKIINYTRESIRYRIYMYVNVQVGEDLDLVKKLLHEVAEENPDIIKDGSVSKPHVRINNVNEGLIEVRLAVYINDFGKKEYIYGKLREAILKKFLDNGIQLPIQRIGITVMNEREGSDE